MKLEVWLGLAHRQPSHRQPRLLGEGHQCFGLCEFRSALMMDDDATGGYGLAHQPLRRHAWQRVATGPACGIERFEFDRGSLAQLAADDACHGGRGRGRCPHPGRIACLEEMITVAPANGALLSRITISTAVEPSQRTVVR